jgi:hypothetical protein
VIVATPVATISISNNSKSTTIHSANPLSVIAFVLFIANKRGEDQ